MDIIQSYLKTSWSSNIQPYQPVTSKQLPNDQNDDCLDLIPNPRLRNFSAVHDSETDSLSYEYDENDENDSVFGDVTDIFTPDQNGCLVFHSGHSEGVVDLTIKNSESGMTCSEYTKAKWGIDFKLESENSSQSESLTYFDGSRIESELPEEYGSLYDRKSEYSPSIISSNLSLSDLSLESESDSDLFYEDADSNKLPENSRLRRRMESNFMPISKCQTVLEESFMFLSSVIEHFVMSLSPPTEQTICRV